MFNRELSSSEKRAEELYRTAMRFLDKGRSASNEAKKAAYRLLDEAAQLKHKESMKLMGNMVSNVCCIEGVEISVALFPTL